MNREDYQVIAHPERSKKAKVTNHSGFLLLLKFLVIYSQSKIAEVNIIKIRKLIKFYKFFRTVIHNYIYLPFLSDILNVFCFIHVWCHSFSYWSFNITLNLPNNCTTSSYIKIFRKKYSRLRFAQLIITLKLLPLISTVSSWLCSLLWRLKTIDYET